MKIVISSEENYAKTSYVARISGCVMVGFSLQADIWFLF